jgi:hypothetical protein
MYELLYYCICCIIYCVTGGDVDSGGISVSLPEMRRTPAGLTRVSKTGVVTGIGKLNIKYWNVADQLFVILTV